MEAAGMYAIKVMRSPLLFGCKTWANKVRGVAQYNVTDHVTLIYSEIVQNDHCYITKEI